MSDAAALQSAINTIRNWYIRRQAQGKTVNRSDVLTRIHALWADVSDEDAHKIADGVMR